MGKARIAALAALAVCASLTMSGCSHLYRIMGMGEMTPPEVDRPVFVWHESPINIAALKNDHAGVAAILAKDPSLVDDTTSNGYRPLHWAALDGSVELATLLLDSGADVNARSQSEETPLHLAARMGHTDLAKLLVERGAACDIKTNVDETPLLLAITGGHIETTEYLLSLPDNTRDMLALLKSASETVRNRDGIVDLVLAAGAREALGGKNMVDVGEGSEHVVESLLLAGVNPNARNGSGQTLLHSAAFNADAPTVKLLLDHKADPNASDDDRQTPLHCVATSCCCVGDKEKTVAVAKLLIQHGAQVNAKDKSGSTPLVLAVGNTDRQLADYLRSKGGVAPGMAGAILAGDLPKIGAMLKAKPSLLKTLVSGDRTPLALAIALRNRTVAAYLIKKGAPIAAPGPSGSSALQDAISNGDTQMALFLLQHGASPTKPEGSSKQTPLHSAAGYNAWQIASALVARRAGIEAKDSTGMTPLHRAAENCGKETVEYLLSRRANVNAKDRSGSTPLHLCLDQAGCEPDKYQAVATELLAHGAQVNARDSSGRTPLFAAAQSGSTSAVEYLLGKGAQANLRDMGGQTALAEADSPEVIKALLLHGAVE